MSTTPKKPSEIRDELNAVSPTFCLAKWLQVTVHLQNGHTHSCHHPGTHKVPLEELDQDASALHNTRFKKSLRKDMLEGRRPQECAYCWNVEDSNAESLSDRTFKSADYWAYPKFQQIAKAPADKSINPSYLEVSWGNECNFKCAYCAPNISSGIMAEYQQHGHYSGMASFALDVLRDKGLYPYDKEEPNPYVDAFWKWWPSLTKDLKVFRITGGEPLLNQNTFRFLEFLKENPMPDLNLAINTNLSVPEDKFEKFIEEIKYITENNLVNSFQLFTSVDTFGKNAEFVRFGLNYEKFMQNVRTFLTRVPEVQLVFMCTYNAFSVLNFRKFLEEVYELKKMFRKRWSTRVILDTPYLKDPNFLSCYVLTEEYWQYIRDDLQWMKDRAQPEGSDIVLFHDHEILKFERILHWVESLEENQHRQGARRALIEFLHEYQLRKDINFMEYCPEYAQFYRTCQIAYSKRPY